MVRKLSRQRQDVIDLLRREGSTTPQRVSSVTSMSAGAARKLLFSMLADGELESPQRGRYTLPAEPSVTNGGDVTESVAATADVTDADKPREDMPILEDSPSGTWGYSAQDGGMVPREELRRRKGYSG
jgi:hypothetical protein